MSVGLLPNLLQAGGITALAIGVFYLLYREILKLGVFPKLKQWQGFALLCLLAILVFAIAMTALMPEILMQILMPKKEPALLDGELRPEYHFQLDAADGVFCEQKSVHQPSAPFFDSIDINIGACGGSDQFGSRSYRVDWLPSQPRAASFASRRGYTHCFVSDFAERAPAFLKEIQNDFERNKEAIPCKVSLHMTRQIRISYVDPRNQSREVAFLQFYNRGGTGRFEIKQVESSNLARNDQMEALPQEISGGISDARVLAIAGQYHYPGIPRK